MTIETKPQCLQSSILKLFCSQFCWNGTVQSQILSLKSIVRDGFHYCSGSNFPPPPTTSVYPLCAQHYSHAGCNICYLLYIG